MMSSIFFAILVSTASCQLNQNIFGDIFGKPKEDSNYKSCLTEKKEQGLCVPYYFCSENITDIEDEKKVIDIRVEGSCGSFLDTCCLVANVNTKVQPILPGIQERTGCGWRNEDGVGFRITGHNDSKANFGEFPWTVVLYRILPQRENIPVDKQYSLYGGGSLIHPEIVLTMAEYVNVHPGIVRVGEWDRQTQSEIYPYQERKVVQTISHQNLEDKKDDIALLFLDKPVELTPNVGLACLPPPNEVQEAGTRCFASGWGVDRMGGRPNNILKKVEVPVVDRETCQKKFDAIVHLNNFKLQSSLMCAGGEGGKDTCTGDGGSPLVCPIIGQKGRYVQSGIVAYGIGCGEANVPGMYFDVSQLRNWIDEAVASKGYDTKVYSAD